MQLSGNNLTSVTYEKCFLAVLTNYPKHMLLKKQHDYWTLLSKKTVVIKNSPVHTKLFYEIYKFSPDPIFFCEHWGSFIRLYSAGYCMITPGFPASNPRWKSRVFHICTSNKCKYFCMHFGLKLLSVFPIWQWYLLIYSKSLQTIEPIIGSQHDTCQPGISDDFFSSVLCDCGHGYLRLSRDHRHFKCKRKFNRVWIE